MNVLIKQAKILDPGSIYHQAIHDVLIIDGIVQEINPSISSFADSVIQLPDLHLSPGWIDLFAHFCEPGYEFKETIASGAEAAAAGGFTRVMVVPNTKPAIDIKAQVEYIIRKSSDLPVDIIPIGAITRNTDGKELAEMYDMHDSGAVSFSDGLKPIQSAGMMVKALQYVKRFDGVIIQLPDDESMAPNGLMNEGVVSTRMGLPGKPILSEDLMVARDISLAAYTDSRLHITGISSPKAVELVAEARRQAIKVTCSVTPYHLFFCDEDVQGYDSYLKVNPPLRNREDMQLLRQALLDGKIDCLASHHLPHEFDSKVLEFEYAKNGMITLQSLFSAIRTAIPGLSAERCVELLYSNPATIFGLQKSSLQIGSKANLTLFQPNEKFTLKSDIIKSKSKNSPFIDKELTGKVAGIINGKSTFFN